MNKTVKKVVVSVSCLIVAGVLFFGGTLAVNTMRYRRNISEVEIITPALLQVRDGTFNGAFDAILVSANVDVTVENNRIVEVVINDHNFGRESAVAAEVVAIEVVDQQTLDVDAVSGATYSSLVILKAIQIALESGAN